MEEFEKLMKREGMGEMIKPLKYIAQIPYPDREKPTILGVFRTPKARDEWYVKAGRGFELADVGVVVEFTQAPAEDDDRFDDEEAE